MSNQTLPKPSQQRNRSRVAASSKGTFRRQTARVEGRRDGKPLIFGWGTHLTRAQKSRIQHLTAFGFLGLVIVAILFTLVFGVLQQNIFIPNQTIVKVNGVSITQDFYRKVLAYDAQDLWNSMQAEIKQHNDLQTAIQQGDQTASQQDQILISQIQSEEGNYAQTTITTATIQQIVEDQLIQQGAKTFEAADHVPASTFEPSKKAIDDKLAAFKKAFPANESYSTFLSRDSLQESDVRAAIAIQLRRSMMQTYLAKKVVSPVQQAHLRHIETGKKEDADKAYAEILKTGDWKGLAKSTSLDTDSKDNGGDMGWVAPWTGDAAIENWAFAPGRKVNDISPVFADASGTFQIVQLLGYETRPVDATLLSASQSNALSHWLSGQKLLPGAKISTPDSDMLSATRNLPKDPDLNATLPNFSQQNGTGVPSP
jgi:hypothetical protein